MTQSKTAPTSANTLQALVGDFEEDMSDTKPDLITSDGLRRFARQGAALLVDAAQLLATVEALEKVTRERDEALSLYRSTCESLAHLRDQMEPCDVHFGARRACGQCSDSTFQHLKAERAKVARLREALEAELYDLTSDGYPSIAFTDRAFAALRETEP